MLRRAGRSENLRDQAPCPFSRPQPPPAAAAAPAASARTLVAGVGDLMLHTKLAARTWQGTLKTM